MKPAFFQATAPPRDIWSEHLLGVLKNLEIPPGVVADNLAASVSMYCRTFHPRGVQSSDLKLLIARAFCAVDDRVSAECVLRSMSPHRHHISRWLEILSELHHFPQLLPYFSHAILRPANWAGAQLDRMWMLDFGRLVLADAERHEMMLYCSVRMMIEKTFVFWDATEGEGLLGLKNLAALNVDERRKQTLTMKDDLLDYITDLFKQQMPLRNWTTVPSLLNLDL